MDINEVKQTQVELEQEAREATAASERAYLEYFNETPLGHQYEEMGELPE